MVSSVLTSLNLHNNHIEGGKALAEALQVNNVLTSLNLEYNQLGAEAGKALAASLAVNSVMKLKRLDVRVNGLGNVTMTKRKP